MKAFGDKEPMNEINLGDKQHYKQMVGLQTGFTAAAGYTQILVQSLWERLICQYGKKSILLSAL